MLIGQQQQHDQSTTASSSTTTGATTSKTTSKYHDTKEKPVESKSKIEKDVAATPKSTTTIKKNHDPGDGSKPKIHVDLATFQKQGMHMNETVGSDEL